MAGMTDIKIHMHKLSGEILRFGIVGTTALVIHYGVYYLLLRYTYLNVAFTSGYIISFLFNFMMTSWFTFKVRPSWRRFLRFAVSHGINYLIQITIFNISLLLGVSNELAPIPVYIISVPASFLLVRCAMMRKRDTTA